MAEKEKFPPVHEIPRLTLYDLYKKVLLGKHREAFAPTKALNNTSETSLMANAANIIVEDTEPYVVLNYCKMMATTFASKMFGNSPVFTIGESGSPEQERLEEIVINNTLNNINIEQAIASISSGGCVYRVRFGKQKNWAEPMPIIEAIPSKNYFAVTSPDNCKECTSEYLAFKFKKDDKWYLKKEIYEPFSVIHELWELDGESIDHLVAFTDMVDMFGGLLQSVIDYPANISMDAEGRIIEETGYPGRLIEYVPNFLVSDEYYGHSDYDNLVNIQHAINKTSSGILRVIMKHIDPKLIMPEGTMQYDENTGKYYVQKEDMDMLELDVETGSKLPRYLTWDSNQGAAQAYVESLFQSFMITADVSLPMLGVTKYGTAESASAIELKMTQTTDAVDRKRMYFDTGLKNILYAAQWLDHYYGNNPSEPKEVNITWGSPVPMDKTAFTDLHKSRVEAKLESRRTAIAAILDLQGEALDAEIDQIDEESAEASSVFMANMSLVNQPKPTEEEPEV